VKNTILLIALAGLLTAGCSEDPEAAERNNAPRTFDQQALAHLKNISAGYVADVDALRLDQSLEAYQRDEREAAMTAFGELLERGSNAQQVNAAIALADLHAQRARQRVGDAVTGWSQLASASDALQATVTHARRQATMAGALSEVDGRTALAETRGQLEAAQQRRQELDQSRRDLEAEVAEMTERRDGFVEQREGELAKAADLRGRSYDAERQTRFDLQVQAAEHTRKADKAGVQAQILGEQIDLRQSRLAVIESKTNVAEARIDALQGTVDRVASQNRQRQDQAGQHRETAETAAGEAVEQLESLAQQFKAKVVESFTAAEADYRRGIELLESARSKAEGPLRAIVASELASRRSGHGQALRQRAVIRAGYADLLSAMAAQANAGAPERLRTVVTDMAEAADEKAKTAKSEAITALQAAVESLNAAVDALSRHAKFEDAADAVREQLATAHESLAALTGEVEHQQQARQIRADL